MAHAQVKTRETLCLPSIARATIDVEAANIPINAEIAIKERGRSLLSDRPVPRMDTGTHGDPSTTVMASVARVKRHTASSRSSTVPVQVSSERCHPTSKAISETYSKHFIMKTRLG
jgi:hypothetical protein